MQVELTATVHVQAPPERVWDLLCDTSRYPEWVEDTDRVTRTDGRAKLFSTYDEVNPIAGPIRGRSHWVVTEFDPPRRQVHRDQRMRTSKWLEIVWILEPAGKGTSFTHTLRGETGMGPLGPVTWKLLERSLRASHRRSAENFAALAAA
jgi:uncharacterized protein YndB with AHSA1/START domain